MEREKSWDIISSLGNYMREKWKIVSQKYKVDIHICGLPSISTFSFKHMDALKFKTFLTQEFLKKGFLANTSFYASTAHNKNIIDNYSEVLEEVFFKLEKCINGELKIDNLLDGEVSHNGFKRLN